MKRFNAGFSMVELMVGILISMLLSLAVAGSARFLSAQAKVSTGTNSVLESLSIGSRVLASGIRMAGFGIADCSNIVLKSARYSGVDAKFPFAAITAGANDKVSDSMTLLFGDSNTGISKTLLTSAAGNTFKVPYKGNLKAGELALITNPAAYDATTNPFTMGPCNIYGVAKVEHITDVPPATDSFDILGTDHTGNQWTNNTAPVADSAVYGLSSFKWLTFSVDANNALVERDNINNANGAPTTIVDDVVMLKLYYGLNDGTFVPATGNYTVANLQAAPATALGLRSVRIFMVARSPVVSVKDEDGTCAITTAAPTSWVGGPTIDLSSNADWKCYRYKTVDMIVPLKNINLMGAISNGGAAGAGGAGGTGQGGTAISP